MKDSLAPAIAFSTALALGVLLLLFFTSGACELSAVSDAIDKKAATGCFDFWLNRYQTLIIGMASVVAASVAAFLVWRQLGEAQKQSGIALGDIYPDFYISVPPRSLIGGHRADFELLILNQNRAAIEITAIEIVSHRDVEVVVDRAQGISFLGHSGGKTLISLRIRGTRASAPKANEFVVTGAFSVKTATPVREITNVTMKVDYQIIGDKKVPPPAICFLPLAPVSGNYWENPEGFHATFRS
jgi:hypothetical protein